MLRTSVFIISFIQAIVVMAVQPQVTNYSYDDCAGSAKPYATRFKRPAVPDSLKVVMINHVGRHGARYPSSPDNCEALASALQKAAEAGTLTASGRRLLQLTDYITEQSAGRWGRLDSLGVAEQQGIAARMYVKYPTMFGKDKHVVAISSYKPRCVLSMYEFLHELALLAPSTGMSTASGPENNKLLRFFDENSGYRSLRDSEALKTPLKNVRDALLRDKPACAVAVVGQELADRDLAVRMYNVVSGAAAMEIDVNPADWFTKEEYNSLWSLRNLKQYLDYSYSTVSSLPAEIASPLLRDIISTTDKALDGDGPAVVLRFGHAETLMPLLSLMHLPGAYYISDDFASVGRHWHDFELVPMAANLQLIIFESPSGVRYARVDINEQPVAPIVGSDDIYVEWTRLRDYLCQLMPREIVFR